MYVCGGGRGGRDAVREEVGEEGGMSGKRPVL